MFKLGVVCGGPSAERGISLNSARSILDHISPQGIDVCPIYYNQQGQAYALSPSQLYSNTPSDFDFKLKTSAKALNEADLITHFKKMDIVLPCIHGEFGEDGQLQAWLEKHHIPFVGPRAKTCQRMFDKYNVAQELAKISLPSVPNMLVKKIDDKAILFEKLKQFRVDYSTDRLVVKPTSGGSSIDVYIFEDSQKALDKAFEIAGRYRNHTALIEPFCQGVEFTIIVLQSHEGNPVALMPTEIETDYDQGSIFDYRRKYLATNQATYHTPARFSSVQIAQIQSDAQKLFSHLEITDFTRFDGWLLQDGTIVFTDLNPISGMEQNSFLFQQTSRIGLTHGETLRYMIASAAKRYQINLPSLPDVEQKNKKNVHVLFGGDTAERQVSVMSGTNVWLKLLSSDHYKPYPFLLDPDGSIWSLPYSLALSHTVEEIVMNCHDSQTEKMDSLLSTIRKNLYLNSELLDGFVIKPHKMSRQEFYALSHERQAFVFLGLHGGDGEGGVMQQALEDQNLYYNGSHASAAKLCMDKYETGHVINALAHPLVSSTMKESIAAVDLLAHPDVSYRTTWNGLIQNLKAEMLIVKPQGDGCSAGIVKLTSADDLQRYIQLLRDKASFIPQGSFTGQGDIIEMPSAQTTHLLFEPFIVTDKIVTHDGVLHFDKKSGWIELTIGIREVNDIYHALNPSITVADADVLSLEEKFQGGTGVNLTPPPSDIVAPHILTQTRDVMQVVAKALGIRNYARIDFFLQVDTGHIIVIEANTLPGLTPSTVIYHQALAETPPQSPRAFLENIIHDAWKM